MKDNRINGDWEHEDELRDKMSELSSNLECFDKISARAFPEKDQDFSDSEFTVSDLENVTGRRRAVPVIKWVSIAAAAVVCIGVLPRTMFFQEFLSDLGTDTNKKYRNIISELQTETESHDYKVYDLSLIDYIADDVLISPIYSCPFEAEETDGINVRVFIREIDGVPTNQIYAVEYAGDYSEANYLAAAESRAKFTEDDIDRLGDMRLEANDNEAYMAACNAFTGDKYCLLIDKDGKRATAASYSFVSYFKEDKDVMAVNTQVLYCNYQDTDKVYRDIETEESEKYYYDVMMTCYDSKSDSYVEFELPEADKLWNTSLNYDGSNAMPKENKSAFNKKDFFANTAECDNDKTLSWYVPYVLADEALVDDEIQTMQLGLPTVTNDFKTPADSSMKLAMRMYEPYMTHFVYSSQSDPTITINIEGRNEQIVVHSGNIKGAFSDLGKERETTAAYDESNVLFDKDVLNGIHLQIEAASQDSERSEFEVKAYIQDQQKK